MNHVVRQLASERLDRLLPKGAAQPEAHTPLEWILSDSDAVRIADMVPSYSGFIGLIVLVAQRAMNLPHQLLDGLPEGEWDTGVLTSLLPTWYWPVIVKGPAAIVNT